VNALGIRRIMFVVDDMDEVVTRLIGHGAELMGDMVQYGDTYRLCYIRGPERIIIGLAEEVGKSMIKQMRAFYLTSNPSPNDLPRRNTLGKLCGTQGKGL